MAERNETPVANSPAPANVLTTKIDPTSARFEANMRFLADLMSQFRNEGEKICEGSPEYVASDARVVAAYLGTEHTEAVALA